jgi:hypothetical protein
LKYSLAAVVCLTLVVAEAGLAQEITNHIWRYFYASETHALNDSGATLIKLQHTFLLPQSQRVIAAGKVVSPEQYELNFNLGHVFFPPSSINADSVRIDYSYYPLELALRWQRNELYLIPTDTDSVVSREAISSGTIDPYFAALEKQGSISRGFSIGNNQSLTLQSGLNFQVRGNLSENLFLEASLTDANTPIQPEGNTLVLNEVDQVYIRFRSPYIEGVLGDFYLDQQQFRLNPIRRKIQGVDLQGRYNRQQLDLSYATAEGSFHSNQLIGIEGNQGPYRLQGSAGESDIVILAGTERVYINGIQVQRGENNDYTIDYSVGEIKFTPQRPIRGNDRILVDFEYTSTNQRFAKTYLRSLYQIETSKNWDVKVGWFRESDDLDKVLIGSGALSEEEREIIAAAGDDQLQAVVRGAVFVGEGNGNYRDSLVISSNDTIYVWTGRQQGDYSVTFTDVGQGQGSYQRESIGYYTYVGENAGRYLPVQLLPLPRTYDMLALRTAVNFSQFTSDIEINGVQNDANSLSALDKGNDLGLAAVWNWQYQNPKWAALRLRQQWRYRSTNFTSLERFDQANFEDYWALTTNPSGRAAEVQNETSLRLQPHRSTDLFVDAGYRQQENIFNSLRWREKTQTKLADSLRIAQEINQAHTRYQAGNYATVAKASGAIERPLAAFRLALNGDWQQREEVFPDSLKRGWQEFGGEAQLRHKFANYESSVTFGLQREAAIYPTSYQTYADSWQSNVASSLRAKDAQLRVSWFHRDRVINETFQRLDSETRSRVFNTQFADTSLVSKKTDLIKIWYRHSFPAINADLRFDYEVGSEQTPIIEKFYLEVPTGSGNFVYDSTLSEWIPDINGTHTLLFLPTGSFQPVTAVLSNIGFDWQGRGLYSPLDLQRSALNRILSKLRVNTLLQIEERSKSEDLLSLYLLLPDALQADSTLSGSTRLRSDLYYYFAGQRHYLNMRLQVRDALNRIFLNTNDNDKQNNRSLDLIHHYVFSRNFTNDLRFGYAVRKRTSGNSSASPENITSFLLEEQLRWQFFRNWTQTIAIEGAFEKNAVPQNFIELSYLEARTRTAIPLAGKGRVEASFTLTDVSVINADPGYQLPFNMAKGKKIGTSLAWGAQVGYAISRYIDFSLNYSGRRDANFVRVLHTGQAEIRAFF